jgi:hypothetical protein
MSTGISPIQRLAVFVLSDIKLLQSRYRGATGDIDIDPDIFNTPGAAGKARQG